MRAERFGSYSTPATTAGIPNFSRRKSMSRSIRLCPRPRWRTVMVPETFRPLPRRFGRSRLFSGVFFVISSLVRKVMYRRAGEVGLTARMAMALGSLDEFDLVPRLERHDRLLPARPAALEAPHALPLAPTRLRPHGSDLHAEDLLHRMADLDLVRVPRDLESHGVQLVLEAHALLGHQRAHEHGSRIFHRSHLTDRLAARPRLGSPFRTISPLAAPRAASRSACACRNGAAWDRRACRHPSTGWRGWSPGGRGRSPSAATVCARPPTPRCAPSCRGCRRAEPPARAPRPGAAAERAPPRQRRRRTARASRARFPVRRARERSASSYFASLAFCC